MTQHINVVHKNIRPFKCNISSNCDFAASKKKELEVHVKGVHQKIKDMKCQLCDFSASSDKAMRPHIRRVHLEIRNHACTECKFSSARKADLNMHKKIHEMKEKTDMINCMICGKEFKERKYLVNHVKSVHYNMKTSKCDVCDKVFSSRGALKTHIESVHIGVKDHKCPICDMAFYGRPSVEMHLRTVHLNSSSTNSATHLLSQI